MSYVYVPSLSQKVGSSLVIIPLGFAQGLFRPTVRQVNITQLQSRTVMGNLTLVLQWRRRMVKIGRIQMHYADYLPLHHSTPHYLLYN